MAGELASRSVDIAARAAARQARILGRIADAYKMPGPDMDQQEKLLAQIFQKFDEGEAHPVLARAAATIAQQIAAQLQQEQQGG